MLQQPASDPVLGDPATVGPTPTPTPIPVGGTSGGPTGGSTSGGSTGSTSGGSTGGDPFQTVADAFISALGQAPSNPGATVLVPTGDTSSGGGGVNIKTIVIVVVVAGAAWFAWKKFGARAASSVGA